ncbi:MAG: hypothetical protein WD530_07170 [Vicingaceae bacterium]
MKHHLKKYVKRIALSLVFFFQFFTAIACDVCQNNQPKGLENISHGSGPDSQWDMVIIWTAAIIVVLTLIFSLKYLIKPNEKAKDHIKNIVLE